MGQNDFTEEELALLSDEEREALDLEVDDDKPALEDDGDDLDLGDDDADDKDGDDDPSDKDDKDDKDSGSDNDDSDGDGDDKDDSGDDGDDDDTPAAEDKEDFVPKLSGDTPEEIQAKFDDLDKQFEEGDIDLRTYNTERDKLRDELYDARIEAQREQRTKADAEKAEASAQEQWNKDINTFMETEGNQRFRDNGVLNGLLDTEVKRLAVTEDVANKLAKGSITGVDLLEMAKDNVLDAIGQATGKEPGDKGGKKKPAAEVPDTKSLHDVPPAEENGTGAGKFAHLDNLSGEKLEAALAKMSPEQQDAYLQGR